MERYFIFKATPETGLGHNLRSILAYAGYADQWDRILCLDMRDFNYYKNDSHRKFFEHFKLIAPPSLRISSDLQLIDSLYQNQSQMTVTENDPILKGDSNINVLYCNVVGRNHPKQQTIPQYTIRLKGELKSVVNNALSEYFGGNKTIGVHFRHGNGEFLHGRFDSVQSSNYQEKYAEVKQLYRDEIEALLHKPQFRNAKIFVASDNMGFVEEMKQHFPQAFSIVNELPDKPFIEHIKLADFDTNIIQNAVIDIWALANTHHLVCTKGLFTEFALENSHTLHPKARTLIHKYSLKEILDDSYEPSNLEDTIHTLQTAMVKMPTPKIKKRLAYFLEKAGNHQEAKQILSDLNQSIKIRYSKKYNENQTKTVIQSGNIQSSLTLALNDLKSYPTDPEIYLHIAQLYTHLGEFDQAIIQYQKLIQLLPGKIGYYLHYSKVLIKKGELEEALCLIEDAIAINSGSAWLYYHKCELLFQLKRYSETLEYGKKALSINPRYAAAYNLLSQTYMVLKNDQKALTALAKSIEIEGNNPITRYQYGKLLHQHKNFHPAIQQYQYAIQLNPKNAHYFDSLSHSFEQLGQLKQALESQLKALELSPNNPWMQHYCGHLHKQLKQYHEAVKNFQYAIQLAPQNSDFRKSLDHTLKKAAQFDSEQSAQVTVKSYDILLRLQSGKGKASATNQLGRFREIIADPLNFAIEKHPLAGTIDEQGYLYLHNGLKIPLNGSGSYYGNFSTILIVNRGIHEPLEEFVFQSLLKRLKRNPTDSSPSMLELGAYWGHYSMWLKSQIAQSHVTLVEPESKNIQAGKDNFKHNGIQGQFIQAFVDKEQFCVDDYLNENQLKHLTILHADIQGYEQQMLENCSNSLNNHHINFLFVSTHSQVLHENCVSILEHANYRIEVSSDYHETTSYDGFIFASSPKVDAIFNSFKPLSREQIEQADSNTIIDYLKKIQSQST